MNRFSKRKRILFLIPVGALAILVFGGIVMLLWNNVLAEVVHVSTVSFWQALGLLVLSKILFSSFSGGGRRNSYWRQRMQEKWANMTAEEKENLKQHLRDRC